MKPTRFAYFRPDTVRAALDCLADSGGGARVLAGGQSLIPLLNQRRDRPTALVSLERLDSLRYLDAGQAGLRIGALTRHADLECTRDPWVRSDFGVLPDTAPLIAHRPIRTRGTFGGSVAYADPTAEWCLLAVLLDAEIVVQSLDGTRVIPAGAFFLGPHRTAREWNELVIEVRFRHPAPTAALTEFAVQDGHLALAAAAVAIHIGPGGAITAARVAVSGVTGRPIRLPGVETALAGTRPGENLQGHVRKLTGTEITAAAGTGTDTQYRTDVAAALTVRALQASIARHEAARGVQQKANH